MFKSNKCLINYFENLLYQIFVWVRIFEKCLLKFVYFINIRCHHFKFDTDVAGGWSDSGGVPPPGYPPPRAPRPTPPNSLNLVTSNILSSSGEFNGFRMLLISIVILSVPMKTLT